MSVSMRDPSRTLLFGGVAFAAALAGAGFYLFFANVPERGAASETIVAAAPATINQADIERRIQERNAFAPRPGETGMRAAKLELAAKAREEGASTEGLLSGNARTRMASEDTRVAEAPAAAAAAEPSLEDRALSAVRERVAEADAARPREEGDRLFRAGLYPEALAYWRKNAEAGDRWAAYRLGVELLDGKPGVVKRDVVEGAKFMLQSAKSNEPRAQFEMGTLYEYGTGVPADLATASEWYRRAAERGYPQAQYNYATMLENGDGVLEDKVEALKFYALAAEQGFGSIPVDEMGRVDNNAQSALDRLRLTLPAADVREAEDRAAAFKPIED